MTAPPIAYRLERLVHRGERHEVWLARLDGPVPRPVAVKRRGADASRGAAEVVAGLRREAARLRALHHRGVVPILGVVEDPPEVAIVQPWLGGGSLADLLAARGTLTPGGLVALLDPVAGALGAFARHGWVHGDLKPSNVLLDRAGNPVLADPAPVAPPVEATPTHLDPHAARTGELDRRSDVYALGVLAYECLTGRLPHRGEPAEVVALAAAGAHRPLRDWPGVAPTVAEAVEAALHPDPRCRPADASALLARLRGALGPGERIELPGPAPRRPATAPVTDHRTVPVGPHLAPPSPGRASPHRLPGAAAALAGAAAGLRRLVARVDAPGEPSSPGRGSRR